MQVCKLFLKIVKKNIGFILLYLGIFTALTVFMFTSIEEERGYVETKVNVYVELEEENTSTKEFMIYLDNYIQQVSLAGEAQVDDALFWDDIDMYLKIPKNFYERLLEGETEILTMKTSPDSLASQSLISEINSFFTQVKENIRLELCDKEVALSYTRNRILENNSIEVTLTRKSSNLLNSMFNTGIYVICALTLLLVGIISFEIRTKDISRRLSISPMGTRKRSLLLALCYCGISIFLVGLISLVGVILFTDAVLPKLGYFILNMSLFAVTMVFMALFVSSLFKSGVAFNCIAVILPLASGFICGCFVDLSLMPSYTQILGHALPNIYIVKANAYINTCSSFDFLEYLGIVWPCFLFMIVFLLGTIITTNLSARSEN